MWECGKSLAPAALYVRINDRDVNRAAFEKSYSAPSLQAYCTQEHLADRQKGIHISLACTKTPTDENPSGLTIMHATLRFELEQQTPEADELVIAMIG